MKIRTDFVTNSSSSSFLFIDFDEKKFKEAMNVKKEISKNKWGDDYDAEIIEAEMDCIRPYDFEEYHLEDLEEILSWYEDELLEDILNIKFIEDRHLSYFEEQDKRKDQLRQALSGELSETQLKRLEVFFILNVGISLRDKKRWDTGEWTNEDEVFTIEKYNQMIANFFLNGWLMNEPLYAFFLDKYTNDADLMYKYAEELVGFKTSELIQYIFGAKKVFYWPSEIGTVEAVKVLKELGYCKFACGHMG